MRIAIFSDIHSNLESLEAVINDIKQNNIDKTYFLGDALSKGPNPKECLELIMNNNIKMILGNHELYFLRGVEIDDLISDMEKEHQSWIKSTLDDKYREYLLNCPLEIKEEINGIKISYSHFFIKDNTKDYPFYLIDVLNTNHINDIISNQEEDLMFIGHEHRIFEINCNNKKVLDVGSSGCNSNNKTHYMILTIEGNNYNIEKREISYNREKFENTFKNKEYPEKDHIAKIFFGL